MDFHENFVILFIFLKIVSLRSYWKMEKYRSVLQQYISFVLLEMFFTVYYHQCDQILIWNLFSKLSKNYVRFTKIVLNFQIEAAVIGKRDWRMRRIVGSNLEHDFNPRSHFENTG